MTTVSNRLEQVVRNTIARAPIIPVKTDKGILVGSVLIESRDNLKNLWKNDQLIYPGVNLNVAAIKLANELAKNGRSHRSNELYSLDQEYGRWLNDSQIHYKNHQKALSKTQFERADIVWARYCESRDRCNEAKRRVERLSIL
jgi:hypothetical protein